LRIDCGLSPVGNDSSGTRLRVRRSGTQDIAEALDSAGDAGALFASTGS
jgi:hypothetical protein